MAGCLQISRGGVCSQELPGKGSPGWPYLDLLVQFALANQRDIQSEGQEEGPVEFLLG